MAVFQWRTISFVGQRVCQLCISFLFISEVLLHLISAIFCYLNAYGARNSLLFRDLGYIFSYRTLVMRMFGWIFSNVIIAMMRSFFYATETEPYRNRILFYRHEVYEIILLSICFIFIVLSPDMAADPEVRHGDPEEFPISKNRKRNCFRHVDVQSLIIAETKESPANIVGISRLRFLPKAKGTRPLINCSAKISDPVRKQLLSVNDRLRTCLLALIFETV